LQILFRPKFFVPGEILGDVYFTCAIFDGCRVGTQKISISIDILAVSYENYDTDSKPGMLAIKLET
jgi:hypothetical protein